jgi:hypothetical protein
MPKSPLSPPMSQDTLPLVHPTVWPQLPELPRQQCPALIAQLLTALGHGEQSKEPSHE